MANILMQRDQWSDAEAALREALELAGRSEAVEHVAFATVKLGQVAQARGNPDEALILYREGLAIFERIGMPREIAQVRQLIAQLEGGGAPADNPLAQGIARARAAAQQGKAAEAIAAQEEAIALARQGGDSRDALVQLSILLFNLGGYYARADRHAEAVRALEEVVALDEQTGHPDLESDRQALENMRRAAALSPEERAQLAEAARRAEEQQQTQLTEAQAQLEKLSPEERAQLDEAARRFQAMSPEEQAALADAARRQQLETLADQARDGAIAALRGQAEREALVQRIQQAADQITANEAVDSPWGELVAYLRAVVALLQNEALPPVPAAYAARLAAIRAAQA
jgi:hypothetical protein